MEINITTVTANMVWSAAQSRIYSKIKRIQDAVSSLEIKDGFCDILQIIFHDNGTEKKVTKEGFVKLIGQRKNDGIAQVIMVTPNGYSFKEEEDDLLFKEILKRSICAIEKTSLREENKRKITTVILSEIKAS